MLAAGAILGGAKVRHCTVDVRAQKCLTVFSMSNACVLQRDFYCWFILLLIILLFFYFHFDIICHTP